MATIAPTASSSTLEGTPTHLPSDALPKLMLGAIGVVYGDIGTSPLYAVQATLDKRYHLALDVTDLYGIVSLIFWSFVSVVTIKYVLIVMRCDNRGEGGSLALYALIQRRLGTLAPQRWLLIGALFATALFYADAMLTPAISVISAVEGLGVVSVAFQPYVVWIALAILISLFAIQRHGTDRVGRMFGPVMLIYFLTIAAMGVSHIIGHPQVLRALSPTYIWLLRRAPNLLVLLAGCCGLCLHGYRSALRRHGPFRPPANHDGVALRRLSCPDAQLHGPGGDVDPASAVRR